MTTPSGSAPTSVPWYGAPKDWAQMIQGGAQGAGSAMQSTAANASSKKEAKEAKRRTLSNMLSQALKRNQGLFRAGQEHADDLNDQQSQAMQHVARGFVEAMKGSTN